MLNPNVISEFSYINIKNKRDLWNFESLIEEVSEKTNFPLSPGKFLNQENYTKPRKVRIPKKTQNLIRKKKQTNERYEIESRNVYFLSVVRNHTSMSSKSLEKKKKKSLEGSQSIHKERKENSIKHQTNTWQSYVQRSIGLLRSSRERCYSSLKDSKETKTKTRDRQTWRVYIYL